MPMIKVVKTAVVLLLVVMSSGLRIQGTSTHLKQQTRLVEVVDGDWQTVSLEQEEFSMATPVRPSVLTHSGSSTFARSGEKVQEERTYSGYADGFVFVLKSYKAHNPAKVLPDLMPFRRMAPITDVTVNVSFGTVY